MMTPCGMYMKPRRTGGLYGLALGWVRPAHGFQKRQGEGGSEPFQAGATIDKEVTFIWMMDASCSGMRRCVKG